MSLSCIPLSVLQFLRDLEANNNREWFKTHKDRFDSANVSMHQFAESLISAMKQHDNIETASAKDSLYRIYRDVRFSKDKLPYKNSWSGYLRRATARLRGGYYYHIEPGNSYVAGGFWGPNKEDLQRIRQEIATDPEELRNILNAPGLVATFGSLGGEQLKTAPQGFPKDHPAVDLLRHKGFILRHDFSDKEITREGFVSEIVQVYGKLRPFFDYMSEVLTTDSNGVSLLEE